MRPKIKAFEEAYHYWFAINHYLDDLSALMDSSSRDLLKAWEMDEAAFSQQNLDLNDKTGNYSH